MKKYLLLLSSFYFSLQLFAQSAKTDAIYFPPTTQQNRAKLYKQMVDTTIRLNLNDPLADSTEGEWNEAFWSIELLVYKNDFVTKKLMHAWKLADSLSEDFQKDCHEPAHLAYLFLKIYPVDTLPILSPANINSIHLQNIESLHSWIPPNNIA